LQPPCWRSPDVAVPSSLEPEVPRHPQRRDAEPDNHTANFAYHYGCVHPGTGKSVHPGLVDGWAAASNIFDKAIGLTADRLSNVMETQ
jgi:hypothetical protein